MLATRWMWSSLGFFQTRCIVVKHHSIVWMVDLLSKHLSAFWSQFTPRTPMSMILIAPGSLNWNTCRSFNRMICLYQLNSHRHRAVDYHCYTVLSDYTTYFDCSRIIIRAIPDVHSIRHDYFTYVHSSAVSSRGILSDLKFNPHCHWFDSNLWAKKSRTRSRSDAV